MNKNNKYAYQRIKSEVPIVNQIMVALLVVVFPFIILNTLVNVKAPKLYDNVAGPVLLFGAIYGGLVVSQRLLKKPE